MAKGSDEVREDHESRGHGLTSLQMGSAPQGALFIWCNEMVYYPEQLARRIGRSDLRIVPFSTVYNYDRYHGCRFSGVVFDHACAIDADAAHGLGKFRACVSFPLQKVQKL